VIIYFLTSLRMTQMSSFSRGAVAIVTDVVWVGCFQPETG